MGGDHKCPLCSATFTRPQHVGRHLRAHTGDRPYECKECPLRFARSDLLSRHVNKAHSPVEEGDAGQKDTKKGHGRRKSTPSSAHEQSGEEGESTPARRSSFGQSQPQLQAQSMYPHHPLLAGAPGQGWTSDGTAGLNGMTPPNFSNPFSTTVLPGVLGNPMYSNGFTPPFTAVPMRGAGSDHGSGSSSMGRGPSVGSLSSMGFEFGFKKRACDQCNHSKVRCDFSDPCLRCAQRNLLCAYNKPQKSRSVSATNSQRISQPMTASGSGNATSIASSSPNSHFSSPLSTNSPVSTVSPSTQYPHRQASMPVLSNNAGFEPINPYLVSNHSSWSGSFPPGPALQVPVPIRQWPHPEQAFDPTLPLLSGRSSSIGTLPNINESPKSTQMLPPLVHNSLPALHRGSASSLGSPSQHLAPTPSLTSHSTSPSSIDEPAERRSSQFSSTSGLWQDPAIRRSFDSTASFLPDPNLPIPVGYSSMDLTDRAYPTGHQMGDAMTAQDYAGIIDPRMQFRQDFVSDDEDGPSSSATSTYVGVDDSCFQATQHRRRSSAGLWASAFNQMTLQDGSLVPMGVPNSSDLYANGQVPHQFHQKRPSFPMFQLAEGPDPIKMPSFSDTKDLWKLFMAEPGSVQTPGAIGETNELGASSLTPRPGIGPRTLSKSNSMPDLLSPVLTGQPFFSTFQNGLTLKPTEAQQSYLPSQLPDTITAPSPDDPVIMRKWRNEIHQRQTIFNMMPGSRMGKQAQWNHMAPPMRFNLNGRPMASVLQHPAALQQTLAPERTPSFGLGEQSGTASHPLSFAKTPSKLSSAMARPGNKRLASQTLVPESQKKAGFASWDEADDGSLADVEDDGGFRVTVSGKPGGEAISATNGAVGVPSNQATLLASLQASHLSYPGVPFHHATWPPLGGSSGVGARF